MDERLATHRSRQVNWDVLRGLSMFFVVVVHTARWLPSLSNSFDFAAAIERTAIICDPVFFMLSGFFALRAQRGILRDYYVRKISSIILPLVIYSVVLYIYSSWPVPNLSGYFALVVALLGGNWWFVPTLIPMLLLAPFLFQALEGLSDEWVLRLSKLLGLVYVWGVVCHVLSFVAVQTGHETVGNILSMATYYLPTRIPGGYFPVFVAGYLVRRLLGILGESQKRALARMGVIAAGLTFVLHGIGVPADDPNQIWVLSSFGLFFLFERVRVPDGLARSAAIWIGKRSYSIYLVQFNTIALTAGALYGATPAFGAAARGAVAQIGLWCVFVIASYLLALLVASVLDTLLLSNAQRLFERFVQFERRGVA